MVAAGPFSTPDGLLYEPLRDLIDLVKRDKPHCLVLMGPFLDTKNQDLQEGDICYRDPATNEHVFLSYDDLQNQIMKFLKTELSRQSTTVILQPSARDINFIHPLPQPPYRQLSDGFVRLGNPSTFRLNDITFSILNADIIKEICLSILAKDMPTGKIELALTSILE